MIPENCWECSLNDGDNWNPGHCTVSAEGKGDNCRYVPGPTCPLVLLAAKDAEIKRLEQYGIDTHREYETMTAERNSYYAETENLRESLAAKDNFLPTPEQVNALPPRLREYIHNLEARCDPSGDVRENIIARDTCRALELALAAKERECEVLRANMHEAYREAYFIGADDGEDVAEGAICVLDAEKYWKQSKYAVLAEGDHA